MKTSTMLGLLAADADPTNIVSETNITNNATDNFLKCFMSSSFFSCANPDDGPVRTISKRQAQAINFKILFFSPGPSAGSICHFNSGKLQGVEKSFITISSFFGRFGLRLILLVLELSIQYKKRAIRFGERVIMITN
jgi:hypothetical protein